MESENETTIFDSTTEGEHDMIDSLTICYDNQGIIGLILDYDGDNFRVIGNKTEYKETTISFKETKDFIVEISISKDKNKILSFELITNNGNRQCWGDTTTISEVCKYSKINSYISAVKLATEEYLTYFEPVYEKIEYANIPRTRFSKFGGKCTVLIGEPCKNEFDDHEWIAGKPKNNFLTSIKVWFNNTSIHEIEFVYNFEGLLMNPDRNAEISHKDLKCEIFHFGEKENIQRALISYDKFINSITFFTDLGNVYSAGIATESKTLLIVRRDYSIYAIAGCYDGGLKNIILFYRHQANK